MALEFDWFKMLGVILPISCGLIARHSEATYRQMIVWALVAFIFQFVEAFGHRF